MKKKRKVIDKQCFDFDIIDCRSLDKIIAMCSKLYVQGYNEIEYDLDMGVVVCKTREETDEEFNKRKEKLKIKKEKEKIKLQKNKEQEKNARRKQYEELKKEFENET